MVSINNSINNTVGGTLAGALNKLTIQNPDNSVSNSQASELITVGGATAGTMAGNVWTQYQIGTTRNFSMGINNSSSQALQINTNTGGGDLSPGLLGSNLLWNMTTAGQRTMPLQPAFVARLVSDTALPQTSANFNVNFGVGGTEVDQNSNLTIGLPATNPGGGMATIFTAPVTGVYMFWSETSFINIPTTAIMQVAIQTSDASRTNIGGTQVNLANTAEVVPGGNCIDNRLAIALLTAGDQVWINLAFSTNAPATSPMLLEGFHLTAPVSNTSFGGFLIC